jgi:hypothetical protein
MADRKKAFDCVEMKRRAQEKLAAEYERRKGEFGSYAEFLKARIGESPWAASMWKRFAEAAAKTR